MGMGDNKGVDMEISKGPAQSDTLEGGNKTG